MADLASAQSTRTTATAASFQKQAAAGSTRRFVPASTSGKAIFSRQVKAYNASVTNNQQAVLAYEATLKDMPEELVGEYYRAKALNNFDAYNNAIENYNAKQQRIISAFEQTVNAPDFPAELREAYLKAKKSGDLSRFNQAVEEFNNTNKVLYDRWKKKSDEETAAFQEYGRQQEKAESYAAAHPSSPQTVLTPEQIANLERGMQYLNSNERTAVQELINNSRRATSGTIRVGPGNLEYISQYDYDKIKLADKVNNTNYLSILREGGVTGLNAVINNQNRQREANYNAWFNANIKSDNYLNSVYLSKGETAAVAAFDKRVKDMQGIYGRWFDKNIKGDKYLNSVLLNDGEQAALKAFSKRQADLQGIFDRWFDKNIKGDKYLNSVYLSEGAGAAINAYDKRYKDLKGIYTRADARYEKGMAELKARGHLTENGDIDATKYLSDVGDFSRGQASTLAFERLSKRLAKENKAINTPEQNSNQSYTDWKENLPDNVSRMVKNMENSGKTKEQIIKSVNELMSKLFEIQKREYPDDVQRQFEINDKAIKYFDLSEKALSTTIKSGENRTIDQYEFNRLWEAEIKKVEAEYSTDSYERRIKVLRDVGISEEAIKGALYYAKLNFGQKAWQGMTPWEESKGEKATAAGVMQMTAEALVPGLYVARDWNNLSNGERAIYIIADALSVLIPAAGVIKAGGAAARSIGFASRAARFTAALKAGGKVALYEALGPLNMVIHPIASARMSAKWIRGTKELLTDATRMTEAVITNSSGQVMLEVSRLRTAKEAAEAIDGLMARVKQGERLFIDIGDARIELKPGALMKEAGGYAHATPDLTPFEQGLEVKLKAGQPVKEQGLFIAHEIATDYAYRAAGGGGAIPLPTQAGFKAEKVWYYKPEDIARMDADPLKPLTFRHAKNMPAELADEIEAIVKKYNGRISGSLNTYIKTPRAPRPNDVDAVFDTPDIARQAQAEIIEAAKRNGFDAISGTTKRDVLIKKGNKYVSIIDCDAAQHHDSMIPKEYLQNPVDIDGFKVETLGEQYIRQSYGAVAGSKQGKRTTSVNKMSKVLLKQLKADGAIVRRPGAAIFNGPATMADAVSTEKLFYAKNPTELGWVKEAESKIKAGGKTPAIGNKTELYQMPGAPGYLREMTEQRQSLWFRYGPNELAFSVDLEKPLTRAQLLKLKAKSLLGIEDLKAPFKPAITVSRKAKAGEAVTELTEAELKDLERMLRREGNITARQGANLLSAARVVTAVGAVRDNIGRVYFIDRPDAKASAERYKDKQRAEGESTKKGRKVRAEAASTRDEKTRAEAASTRTERIPATAESARRIPLPPKVVTLEMARRIIDVPERRVPVESLVTRVPPPATSIRTPPAPPDTRIPPSPPDTRVPPEPPRTPPPTPPPPIRPPKEETDFKKGKSDAEKRAIIRKAAGFTTFNMGKLHGKDVWHVKLDSGEKLVVIGPKPEGTEVLADGPGSAYKTTQRVGLKKGFETYTEATSIGFMRATISPNSGKPGATAAFKPQKMSRKPAAPSPVGRSKKIGKVYQTPINGVTGYSRKPIRRRR